MKKLLLSFFGLSLFAMNAGAWDFICLGSPTPIRNFTETDYYFTRNADGSMEMLAVQQAAIGEAQSRTFRCVQKDGLFTETVYYDCGDRELGVDLVNGNGTLSYGSHKQDLQCRYKTYLRLDD